jgi:hypothetical protein
LDRAVRSITTAVLPLATAAPAVNQLMALAPLARLCLHPRRCLQMDPVGAPRVSLVKEVHSATVALS